MDNDGNLIVTTSWDDGVTCDIKLAEMLDKYKLQGTFYVSRIPGHNLLQEKDIIELGGRFEIGAHTMNHPDLTAIPHEQAEKEISNSKKYLEDLLGHSVSMFCYPFGHYNESLKEILKRQNFNGARTCEPGGFSLPQDPYKWHITLFASNGSPLLALKICLRAHIWSYRGLFDWESRAKFLFDLALRKGGVYHIYGHSEEFESNKEWDKLQRVFTYISNKDKVHYLKNGEILERYRK